MIRELKSLFEINQNFMVKAPRRYGKTSLVKETLRQLDKDYLYIDLRRMPRLSMVIDGIMDFTYEQAGVKGFMRGIVNNVMTVLKNSKHSLKISNETLEYSAEFFLQNKTSLKDLLRH